LKKGNLVTEGDEKMQAKEKGEEEWRDKLETRGRESMFSAPP